MKPLMNNPILTDRYQIRAIEPGDNARMAEIIVSVLKEFGRSGPGFACNDPETQALYQAYQQHSRCGYEVIVDSETGRVMGGGGYIQLLGTAPQENICELQKLYLCPETRGLGLGDRLIRRMMEKAAADGYTLMYLETLNEMQAAMKLYEKHGFEYIDGPMGDTGHYNCQKFMIRPL